MAGLVSLEFLADVNVERGMIQSLREYGYDTIWIAELNPEMTDEDILKLARDDKRILITNDKDFGELIFYQKLLSRGIILFRTKNLNSQEKIRILKNLLIKYDDKIPGHYVIVSPKKYRFISLRRTI